jgi:hypothetical protein
MLKRQITQTHRFCQQAKWLWPLKNIKHELNSAVTNPAPKPKQHQENIHEQTARNRQQQIQRIVHGHEHRHR